MATYRGRLFQKTSNFRLSYDVERWPDEIYTYLSQTHPYLVNYAQGDIDWTEEPIDEEMGSGVGTITVLIGERPYRVPVVVRDFELKPIDVYWRDGETMDMLAPELVMQHIAGKPTASMGLPIDPNSTQTNSIINKVGGYANFSEDCERVMDRVEKEYPKLAASCNRLKKKAENGEELYDTMVVSYTGDTYKLSSYRRGHKVNEYTVPPKVAFMNPESVLAEACRAAKLDGEAILSRRVLDKVAEVPLHPFEADSDSYKGIVGFIDENGDSQFGTFMKCASLRAKNEDHVVILTENGHLNGIDSAAISKYQGDDKVAATISSTSIGKAKGEGFLKIGETVYGPINVRSNFKSIHNEQVLSVVADEVRLDLVLSKMASSVMDLGGGKKLIPASAEFIPSPAIIPLGVSSTDILSEKTAHAGLAAAHIKNEEGRYSISVMDVEHTQLTRGESIAVLGSLGLRKEASTRLLDMADYVEGKTVTGFGVEQPKALHLGVKEASNQRKIDTVVRYILPFREAITKLASEVQEEDLQDDLNSVNLINQHNAMRFADATDELEAAKQEVAAILHGIRSNEIETVDEQTAKDGLVALDHILRGMQELEAEQ